MNFKIILRFQLLWKLWEIKMVGVNRNRDNLTLLLSFYLVDLGIVKFCGLIGIILSKLFKRIVSQKKKIFSKKNFFFCFLDLGICEWIWGGKFI